MKYVLALTIVLLTSNAQAAVTTTSTAGVMETVQTLKECINANNKQFHMSSATIKSGASVCVKQFELDLRLKFLENKE